MKALSIYMIVAVMIISTLSFTGCSKAKEPAAEPAVVEETPAADASAISNQAADFTLNDINGAPVHLSDYAGKVRIVDFWATWCPPCLREIPHFNDLYNQYKDKGLVVIGVSVDQGGWDAVKKFLQKTPITYPVVQEETGYEFKAASFAAPGKIGAKIAAKDTPLMQYLWGKIPANQQAGLITVTPEALAGILNGLVLGEKIYEAERFAGVDLGVDPQRLVGFNPGGEKLRGFNRYVLEKTFSEFLTPKVSDTYQSYLPPDQQGGIPYTFIIDRQGNIVEKIVGYREKAIFEEAIKKLL